MKKRMVLLTALLVAASVPFSFAQDADDGWVKIFNGKNLDGWKDNAPGDGGEFAVENGEIVGKGTKNHLFYREELKNFELKIDASINNKGNSGVYVKSPWVDKDWPTGGFEIQLNATHSDPVKTGSLYNIIKLFESPVPEDTWFTYHLIVKGDSLTVKVNDKVLYTYVDPAAGTPETALKRISQKGHIALQQHDPGSHPKFKNVYLKKLSD
ncbi:MAG: DUF1080 domain-containing protein [Planctomycetaceae bacterium]|jgi:hypothetical protein|nr:DUF1080 domain-containing protein [Planctomycetaceae bacterium]